MILENVKGLLVMHATTMALILQLATRMKDERGQQLYAVEWKCLNARLHAGSPHNRERIFIVMTLLSARAKVIAWPEQAGE